MNEPLNILLVCDYYPPSRHGGVGYIVACLRAELVKSNHMVTVITTGEKYESDKLENVLRIHRSLFWGVLLVNWYILKICIQQKVDIINLHQSLSTLFLIPMRIMSLFGFKKPRVVNSLQVDYVQEFKEIKTVEVAGRKISPSINDYINKYIKIPLHIVLELIGYYMSDHITTVSQETKRDILSHYGFLKKRIITYIPNGLNLSKNVSSRPQIKSQDIPTFLFVGAFKIRKRLFHLLHIFKSLINEKKLAVKLDIVGSGSRKTEEKLIKYIKDNGLIEHIRLIGSIPNHEVKRYMKNRDFFILLSSYEGMSVAMLEAISLNKVVIVTKNYGAIDIFDPNAPNLVEKDNIDEAISKISDFLNNSSLLSTAAIRNQEIWNTLSWDKIAVRYLDVYLKGLVNINESK